MTARWHAVIGLALAVPGLMGLKPLETLINGVDDACFERTYTPEHLAAHPDQTVTYLRFEHFPGVWGPIDETGAVVFDRESWQVHYRVELKLRRTGDMLYETSGTCRPAGDHLECGVDCDGGSFTLHAEAGDRTVLLRPSPDGFAILACGEDPDAEAMLTADPDQAGRLLPGKDDKVFRLNRVTGDRCVAPPVPTL